jgi:hypothetical protein
MKSTFLTLSTRDFIKGAVMAAIIPVLLIIQQSIAAGDLVFNWKAIAMGAIAGFVGYLLKNWLTDSTVEAVKTLNKQNVTITEDSTKLKVTPENVKEIQIISAPNKNPQL